MHYDAYIKSTKWGTVHLAHLNGTATKSVMLQCILRQTFISRVLGAVL